MTARTFGDVPNETGTPPLVTTGAPSCLTRANAASTSRTTTMSVNAPTSWMRRSNGLPPAFLISTISTPVRIAGGRPTDHRICASGRPNMFRSAGFASALAGAPVTSSPMPSR